MKARKNNRASLLKAGRIVVKIGSRALVNKRGKIDKKTLKSVAESIKNLMDERGARVTLVSSGAILAGKARLGILDQNLTLPQKQAAAAVGQRDLMDAWAKAFSPKTIGQVLLTAEDMGDRRRFLNARGTLDELFSLGVVPVINENDTVAVEEIRYGDNDHIATLVAGLVGADLLILLTDIDGLCGTDPADDPCAEVIDEVSESDAELFACAGPSHSGVGSGGMRTKIEAARTAAKRGIPTVIANAKTEGAIDSIASGETIGTLFVPTGKAMKDRQFWLAFAGEPRGTLKVDKGAAKAVGERNKSLLPSGIIEVSGRFGKGDLVKITGEDGKEVARGLSNYTSGDMRKIVGLKSSEIEGVLGEMLYEEAVHRDNLIPTGGK